MKDEDLGKLLSERDEAWTLLGAYPGRIKDQSPRDRSRVDHLSNRYRDATRSIVAELRERGRPALVTSADGRPVSLHLTKDRLSFVELDPESGMPIYCHPDQWRKGVLYRYPAMVAR